jgi:hypothetical protein
MNSVLTRQLYRRWLRYAVDRSPKESITPERSTSADRFKAALREHPVDAGFADDLATAHADLRSAFNDEVRGWPGE